MSYFLPRNTFTFISSSHDTVSWLDHILITTSGYSLFTDICVKSDFITSDHLHLCFTISVDNLNVQISSPANKGVNPGGDGGDVSPPCFDMGGITCLLSPPHVLTLKSIVFLAWKINNIL